MVKMCIAIIDIIDIIDFIDFIDFIAIIVCPTLIILPSCSPLQEYRNYYFEF